MPQKGDNIIVYVPPAVYTYSNGLPHPGLFALDEDRLYLSLQEEYFGSSSPVPDISTWAVSVSSCAGSPYLMRMYQTPRSHYVPGKSTVYNIKTNKIATKMLVPLTCVSPESKFGRVHVLGCQKRAYKPRRMTRFKIATKMLVSLTCGSP